MESNFWTIFGMATALKVMLIPAYHSTDFEVHRNWLAITHSLPIGKWYYEATSEWTLDYPPFFAYFEWLLSQVAKYVDPKMLNINNLNYASEETKYFQRCSVMVTDLIFAWGVWRCMKALKLSVKSYQQITGEVLLLLNVGLIFVDHIHFQYNGMLFGLLLLSISYLLEEQNLKAAFVFSMLLNFKHIFLYMAPAFGIYLLRFYCWGSVKQMMVNILKLGVVGLVPFVFSFGPFWNQLPQLFSRLFPFKRGLTHAYWAPNFWALYNTADKVTAVALRVPRNETIATSSSGLVQEVIHQVLPTITPKMTFLLTLLFMFPILVKLCCFTNKSESKITFLRAVVLCSAAAFVFGWHVHEKAILMCLIPLTLLSLLNTKDAKYAYILSICGYFSLFPLLFHMDLFLVRYSLYLAYVSFMYAQFRRLYNKPHPNLNLLEILYIFGFLTLPTYEHLISPIMGLNQKLPFMPLLLTSVYCSLGVLYFFIRYYIFTLSDHCNKSSVKVTSKSKQISQKSQSKKKLKQKTK